MSGTSPVLPGNSDAPQSARTHAKLLFFVTEDWYFCSHRLPLALAARDSGFEVVVVTRVRKHGDRIRAAGLRLVPFELSRRGMNPLREIAAIYRLWKIYRRERPDIAHHVAMKPVLYGSLAARLAHCAHAVNALAGMGFLFISDRPVARLLRPLVLRAFRLLLNGAGSRLILQNPEDVELFAQGRIVDAGKVALIRGSGVDMARFAPAPEPAGPPVIVLASRMLWDKGVREFVEAAATVNRAGPRARFVLVGDVDAENPSAIPRQQLEAWARSGAVEWWGHRDDMPAVFQQAHLVCLPSYREGLPKVLLEAASCARPIVATDVPGCREIVRDGVNGLRVPARDAAALAAAVIRLLDQPETRLRMGEAGRRLVQEHFSEAIVIERTLALYADLLAGGGRC